MKSAFFAYLIGESPFIYMAKVHKSVGFGTRSADARDNPFLSNNEVGLPLSHQPEMSSGTAWNRRKRKPRQYGKRKVVNLFS
jgi:hypothetical protein